MVYAPTGIYAVYQDSASVQNFHYIHTDYLGSWLKITNQNGTVENSYSYDAWGRPRNPNTWALMPISITNALCDLNSMQPRFDRGYTGHEHMAGFGLINMNGRLGVYPAASGNPYLQRFLSPDNFVQNLTNAQNYNRYSYCSNNPLMYTDPSGWQQLAADQGRDIDLYFKGYYSFDFMTIGTNIINGCSGGGSGPTSINSWGEFWNIVDYLWVQPYGGNWQRGVGIHCFANQKEAFIAGCNYIDKYGTWGNNCANNKNEATVKFLKNINSGKKGQVWYYLWDMPGFRFAPGHALLYNPSLKECYEVNYKNNKGSNSLLYGGLIGLIHKWFSFIPLIDRTCDPAIGLVWRKLDEPANLDNFNHWASGRTI